MKIILQTHIFSFAHICECGQKGKWIETLGIRQTDFKCEIIVQIFKESGSLKVEKKNMNFMLNIPFQNLSHGTVGVPKIHHFGTCGGKYNALVMDLLGPNLEELFNSLNRKFSLKTILMMAVQLLSRIEHIHQ